MDCWIGVVDEGDRRRVRLAGQLTATQVPELLEACASAGRLELDLSELVAADPAGVDVLQGLRSKGAYLVGAPGYIQLKIDSCRGVNGKGPRHT